MLTFRDQPVKDGVITFLPAKGGGPTTGAVIRDGQYRVDEMLPGKKTLRIVSAESQPFARSTAEMAQQADRTAKSSSVASPERRIPADAKGNNVQVEVVPGNQVLDFHLE